MEFNAYLEQVRQHAAALRAAAVEAGPDAVVPTTPGWDVRALVRHIARVHHEVRLALDNEPTGGSPRPSTDEAPEDWEMLLDLWDERLEDMLGELAKRGADARVWAFGGHNSTTAYWARRQAHETAIHRLDAEHAAHGDAVDPLMFDPELAADGIDEALTVVIALRPVDVTGTVLFHAADAGRAWLVTLTAGERPEIGPATEIDTDASVVGTADAVYRAVWGRPSTAVVTGDPALVAALRTSHTRTS